MRALAVDVGGKLLVTGDVAGVTDFGGTQLASAGGADVFVAKLDTAGGVSWARRFGDINLQYGRSVSADLFENVFVTGETLHVDGGAHAGHW